MVERAHPGFCLLRRLWVLLLSVLLTSCVSLTDFSAAPDNSRDVLAVVSGDNGAVFTQSFIPPAGFSSLTIWVSPESETRWGTLTIELARPFAGAPVLFVAQYPLEQLVPGGSITLAAPAHLPARSELVVRIFASGSPAAIRGRNENVYPAGEAKLDGELLAGDAALRMAYTYSPALFWEDVRRAASESWLIAPLILIIYAPGALLLALRRPEFDFGERAGLAIGLSLALLPLLFLWAPLAGLRWSALGAKVLFVGIGLALVVFNVVKIYKYRLRVVRKSSWIVAIRILPSLALAGVFLLTFGSRLVMARDLAAPPWVDSLHHGAITRLLLDSGALPDSYQPLIPIQSIEYHAGFHTSLAFFNWLSGLPLQRAMLLLGQVLNASIVFAAYLLTTTLFRPYLLRPTRQWAGVIAALIAGLATPMPAYYTSWGRYTQLAGLLILPAVFALTRIPHGWRSRGLRNGAVADGALAALALGGLFLVHYRVAAFAFCLLAAVWFSQLRFNLDGWGKSLAAAAWLLLIVAGGVLLALPWAFPAMEQVFLPVVARGGERGIAPFSDFSWHLLTTASGKESLFLAGLGMLWALVTRWRAALALAIWCALLFFLANLGALGLPGGGFVNNLSVTISLFLPIAAAGGYFFADAGARWLRSLRQNWLSGARLFAGTASVVLALLAARSQLALLNPNTILFYPQDEAAINWAASNTPREARFLINPFAWGYGLYGGSDGGAWLPALAGRATFPPPVIYGLAEPDVVAPINTFAQQIISSGQNPQALWELMQAEGIAYVFVGGHGGPLAAGLLQQSPLFETLYAQDGAWIFIARPGSDMLK